jgi:chromosome segregation ATPase
MSSKVFVLVVGVLLVSHSHAEVSTRGGSTQAGNSKAQYLLKKISAENAALKAEIVELTSEIEAKDKKIKQMGSKLSKNSSSLKNKKQQISNYQKTVSAQRGQIDNTREKFGKLVTKYRELVSALKLMELERTEMQAGMAEVESSLSLCHNNNEKLSQVAEDALAEYRNKGFWDALLEKEPVTQIRKVEIENYVYEKEYKINKLKVADK